MDGDGAHSTTTQRPIRFSPATEAADPPQGHDAKCGFACHTLAKSRDYVFTEYAHR